MCSVPQILIGLGGETISNVNDWEQIRRRELLNLLSQYVYGVRPMDKPDDFGFEVTSLKTYEAHKVLEKKVTIRFCGYSFPIRLFVPLDTQQRVPCFVYVMHEYQEENIKFDEELNQDAIPIADITSRGYGIAVMPTSGIAPDWEHKANYEKGVFSIFLKDKAKRKPDSWATISAWAWGASRVLDYLEQEPLVDGSKVGVVGHSRGGKTALWCGATDTRFTYVISNNSGCAGAAMHRGKYEKAEHIKDINITDWFCENYLLYNDRDEWLPVDQHMLLSLIAPRLLYVASASEDLWADPASELKSCVLAGEAYELYGKKGLIIEDEPKPDTPYHDGKIAYHVRTGTHKITRFDWDFFMNFWDKNLK